MIGGNGNDVVLQDLDVHIWMWHEHPGLKIILIFSEKIQPIVGGCQQVFAHYLDVKMGSRSCQVGEFGPFLFLSSTLLFYHFFLINYVIPTSTITKPISIPTISRSDLL